MHAGSGSPTAPRPRPVHVEHGHAPGCARLARDQAAEDARRRKQVPGLILDTEPAAGPVQRHWLRERIPDDCPRCGGTAVAHLVAASPDVGADRASAGHALGGEQQHRATATADVEDVLVSAQIELIE